MKKRPAKLLSRITMLVVIMAMLMSMFSFASATTANQRIQEDRNGVLCIEYCYYNKSDNTYDIWGVGSAFLINEETLLTCYHCVHNTGAMINSKEYSPDELAEVLLHNNGREWDKDWRNKMRIRVVLAYGSYVLADERKGNEEVDFSILKLSEKVENHLSLTLRQEPADTTEQITAMGFPYTVSEVTEGTATKFTAKDVTTTSGTISKGEAMNNGIMYIQHNAVIKGGSSGGPLVDNNGLVVGINASADPNSGDYGYAVSIDQVIITLDALGIPYQSDPVPPVPTEDPTVKPTDPPTEAPVPADKAGLQAAISAAQGKNQADYTAESWADYAIKLEKAKDVAANEQATQDEIDDAMRALNSADSALVLKEHPNVALICGVAAAVVVLLIVIIVLVTRSGKKGRNQIDEELPYNIDSRQSTALKPDRGSVDKVTPHAVDYRGSNGYAPAPETSDLGGEGIGTTLLTNSGDTEYLSGKAYATLSRKSNNDICTVNKPEFTIGRERRKADYYISNNAVGRTHAKLTNEGGKVYITDMDSKNGTFVNGVKCAPNIKVELHSGDTLTLADEDFEVRLS